MSERTTGQGQRGYGSEQPSGAGADHDRRSGDETTSVFSGEAAGNDTTKLDRPNVPLGSPAPPWQRGAGAGPTGGSGSDSGSSGPGHGGPSPGHYGSGGHGSGGPGPMAAGGSEQTTVTEKTPSYAPPLNGGPPPHNPFLTPSTHGSPGSPGSHGDGGPPPVIPGPSMPLGAGPGPGGPGGPGMSGGGMPGGGMSGAAGMAGAAGISGAMAGANQQRQPARPGGQGMQPGQGAGQLRNRSMRAAPRRASLQLRRFDPWSVLKLSLVMSVALFLMWLVAVGVLYGVLDGMGVWDKLNGAYSDLASVNEDGGGGEPLISAGRVFGVSAVVGVVNIVLLTAFATVSAFVYNVSSDLAGGIELTLSERD